MPVNRYHPNFSLRMQPGHLEVQISKLRQSLHLNTREHEFSKSECLQLQQLVNLESCALRWENVIEVASRAIFIGCGPRLTLQLYRAWIEALFRLDNFRALRALGLHLLKQRRSSLDALALSLMSLLLSQDRKYSKVIRKYVFNSNEKSYYRLESLAIFGMYFGSIRNKQKALQILSSLCHSKKALYWTHLQALNLSRELSTSSVTAKLLERLKVRFERSPYPYWAVAKLAFDVKDYPGAVSSLQKRLFDMPNETLSLLFLADCYQKTGDLLGAADLLEQLDIIEKNLNYDVKVSLGQVYFRLWKRYNSNQFRQRSKVFLKESLQYAKAMRISQAPIKQMLDEISLPKNATGNMNVNVWLAICDNNLFNIFEEEMEVVLPCPSGVKKGDKVYFANFLGSRKEYLHYNVLGCVDSISDATANRPREICSIFSRLSVFPEVNLKIKNSYQLEKDLWGCENYSKNSELKFVKLEEQDVYTLERLVNDNPGNSFYGSQAG